MNITAREGMKETTRKQEINKVGGKKERRKYRK